MPVALPLVPPSVGSAVITPCCHTKARDIRSPPWHGAPFKHVNIHCSANGSKNEDWATPTISPLSAWLPPKATALLGPPSVLPRSVRTPFRHSAACSFWSPVRLDTPV